MKTCNVEEIRVSEDGRLYVKPDGLTFPYIYREAMEVSWDKELKSFYSPHPREWTYLEWYRQIHKAAIAQSCQLKITFETLWVNISDELKESISAEFDEKGAE